MIAKSKNQCIKKVINKLNSFFFEYKYNRNFKLNFIKYFINKLFSSNQY